MADRAFHHGNLRAELLEHAGAAIREHGVEALSLREIARTAGVSHAAPRRHFADRQALLDALAAAGFRRLTALMREVGAQGGDYPRRFRRVARAYVRFAIDDAALMELMFTAKNGDPSAEVQEAAAEFFAVMGELFARGRRPGLSPVEEPQRLQLLLVATLQGIATLAATGRIGPDQIDQLVDDTAVVFAGARPGPGTKRASGA